MLFLLTDVTLADEDSNSKPEAQRTQGIESTSWIIFLTELNLYPL